MYKLKRKTAWLWRFITFLQQQRFGNPLNCNEPLSVQELQIAEQMLIKHLQRQHFPYCFTSSNQEQEPIKSLPQHLQKLQPVVIDGVLRVGGRLTQAPFELDVKHPIILPQTSHFTELVIRQHHAEVGHSGSSHTWASLRR